MAEITILGLALAVLLTLSVLYRLVERVLLREEPPQLDLVGRDQLTRIDALGERRALLVRELKDIEFDYETGKIDDADYERLTRRYQRHWLEVDRELEALAGLDAELLDEVDAEIERRLEADAPRARAPRPDRRVCAACGAANPREATRCFDCEATLTPDAPQPEDPHGTTRSKKNPSGKGRNAVTTVAIALLGCATLFAPLSAQAQGALAPGQRPPNDAVHGAPAAAQAPAGVRLSPADVAGAAEPVGAGTPVLLQWRADRGQRLARSYEAVTDAQGVADFGTIEALRDTRRFELRALVQEGSVPHLSDPLAVHQGQVQGQVRMLEVTHSPSAVVGASLITIMGVPAGMNQHPASYGYVQVQQLVELTTSDGSIFDGSAAGVMYEAPIKAQSVQAQVMGGSGGKTEVSDNKVRFNGTIYPPGDLYPTTRMMVSFYLEADGSTLDYEQPMTLPFADVRLTFLRETDLPGRPLIDVAFDAPDFAELDDEATDGTMEGRHVIVARGLSLAKGDVLSFEVQGLPYPDDHLPWILSAMALVLMLGGVFLGRHELRQARERRLQIEAGGSVASELLEARIEALYAGLAELERDFEAGEIDALSYERERGRLRTRLALLIKRR